MQVHATHLLPMALTEELAVSSMPPLKVSVPLRSPAYSEELTLDG